MEHAQGIIVWRRSYTTTNKSVIHTTNQKEYADNDSWFWRYTTNDTNAAAASTAGYCMETRE